MDEKKRLVLLKLAESQHGKQQVCGLCGVHYSFTAGEPYRPQAVCADCWTCVSEIEKELTNERTHV